MGGGHVQGIGDLMKQHTKRTLLIIGVVALFLLPIAAFAGTTSGFDDVPNDNIFAADIGWMNDNGITKGCNPPTNNLYCPKDNVTREQMSAFMHRLARNKVVDAKTAITAENADTVDGKHAEDLMSNTGSISSTSIYTALSTPTVLSTMTGFDVPASGGVLTVDANVNASIPPGDPAQLGLAWLEIDKGGTCGQSPFVPGGTGFYLVNPTITIADTTTALVTQEVAAGTHRIDLCTIGITLGAAIQADTHMNATWSPNTSAAGVAASSLKTYKELLAPYQGMYTE
jgi:hypothetical protein